MPTGLPFADPPRMGDIHNCGQRLWIDDSHASSAGPPADWPTEGAIAEPAAGSAPLG
ncbi:hypothetical protein FRACA_2740004 [Frankia canadensis]|uniref:Uncharacterized protein n=1 Tax=Frankia canadensis TaxID=1836972 RepID=A0A2I2KSU1_9ACTN|nr:hypothetical protein FRACA_2740004 [Frankia canadensis]SOU56033.1 hypothetical protein FRACA_2740004 [Frankia canadensis]